MKYLIIGLIASVMIFSGCASNNKTAVTVYDSNGKVVQETTKDAVMMNQAYQVAAECEKAKKDSGNVNLGVIDPASLKGLSATAQTEYMRTLPMLHMASALKASVAKDGNPCQQSVVAYYNHLNVVKKENSSLWRKGLGILGFVGGAYVIGNSVEGILQSAVSAGGTTNSFSGSRVNQDSGNNYNSPDGVASATTSGDGLGTANLFGDSSTYNAAEPMEEVMEEIIEEIEPVEPIPEI